METKMPKSLERLMHLWDPPYLREWARSYRGKPGLRAFAVRQLEVFVVTARGFLKEDITLRAAALTYHTLLSIVPLLAVGFALFKAFGGLRKLEQPLRELVMENLAVGRAEEVGQWLDQFISKVSAGAIAGVGVLFLFYSAVGLLTEIESSINRIWGIRRGRPFLIRFAIYWCLITLAPPLIGFSVSLTARFQSAAPVTAILGLLPFGLGRWLLALTSVSGVCLAFVLTYLIVPAGKVRIKAALLGGVVAGILFSVTKYLFMTVGASTLKYSAIYGALGVLPLLMLWIYVSWIIVLFGATYAHANHAVWTDSAVSSTVHVTQAGRELLAVQLSVLITSRFKEGHAAPTSDSLARATGAPPSLVQGTLETLVEHRVLVETGTPPDLGYVPARDPQELTVADVLETLRRKEGISLASLDGGASSEVRRVLEEAEQHASGLLRRVDLRGLALRSEQQTAAQPEGEQAAG